MPDLILETITDNLAEGYKRLERGTFQESSEVQNQRRGNTQLRGVWVYTANLPLYRSINGCLEDLEFGLSGRPTFDAIAGADIDKFTSEILASEGHVFSLSAEQIQLLPSLSDIVWAKTSDLG